MSKRTLAVVVNHNLNDEAINLKNIFKEHFNSVIIIDSGSDVQPDEFDIKLTNVGYSGLFNRAVQEVIEKEYDWLLFVCSDVVMKKSDVDKLKINIDELPGNIGVYSPASTGQSHKHCKNHSSTSLRDVVFVEGFIFAANRIVLEKMYPVDTSINKLGHGLDAYKGFLCLKNKMRCVVDDKIIVYHREGTGYNTGEASNQFLAWMSQPHMGEFSAFWSNYLYYDTNSDEALKTYRKK
jgi:hypothetical protein